MHRCKLEDILTDDEIVVLSEVLHEALESGIETLNLHKQDRFPEDVETYLGLIATQEHRIDVVQRVYNMLEGG